MMHVGKTSSSPSGHPHHLGHNKSILKDDIICQQVYTTLMSVPFEFGLTLNRWLNALQVMLEKVKGHSQIDNLRVIQILERGRFEYDVTHHFWKTTINLLV